MTDTNASRKSEDGSIITLVASDLEHFEHWPKYEKEVTPPAASNIEESATGANVGEAQAHIASNEKDSGMRATNFTQASAKVASWITEKRGEASRFAGTIAPWKKIKDNLLSIIGIARKAWKAAPASPGVEVVPTKATFGVINQPEVGNQDLRSVQHNGSSKNAGRPQHGDADSTTKPADVPDDKPYTRNKPYRCGSKHKYKKCCGKSKEPEQKDREGEVAGLEQQDGDGQVSGPKQVGDEDEVTDNGGVANEEEAVDTTHGDDDSSDNTPPADEGIVTQSIDAEFEYGDRGGFNMDDIFVALGSNKLDQERYDRLKDGFMHVIASILGRI